MRLNSLKFVSEATLTFNEWLGAIDKAETYETAREKGSAAFGYIDCMITFMNTSISMENNTFTEQLDELLDSWKASVYQHMADKAIETEQPQDVVMKLLKKRDGYGE